MTTWNIVVVVLLALWCGLGVLMTVVRLPGTWVILAGAAAYGWWNDWQAINGWVFAAMTAIAVFAEVVELFMSIFTARRAGASRQAAWGGLLGGILGMFVLSIPVPLIGSVVGALLGCFTGAMIVEWVVRNEVVQGTKVGFFSALGFALGAAAKLAFALAMTAILLTSVVCRSNAYQSPSTAAQRITL